MPLGTLIGITHKQYLVNEFVRLVLTIYPYGVYAVIGFIKNADKGEITGEK